MGTGGSFSGGKVQPGRDADHSPPSSTEVKNEWELYFLSPHVPPWRVAGQLYFFYFLQYNMYEVESRKVKAAMCYCSDLSSALHCTSGPRGQKVIIKQSL
jgi:hypothetical protein